MLSITLVIDSVYTYVCVCGCVFADYDKISPLTVITDDWLRLRTIREVGHEGNKKQTHMNLI